MSALPRPPAHPPTRNVAQAHGPFNGVVIVRRLARDGVPERFKLAVLAQGLHVGADVPTGAPGGEGVGGSRRGGASTQLGALGGAGACGGWAALAGCGGRAPPRALLMAAAPLLPQEGQAWKEHSWSTGTRRRPPSLVQPDDGVLCGSDFIPAPPARPGPRAPRLLLLLRLLQLGPPARSSLAQALQRPQLQAATEGAGQAARAWIHLEQRLVQLAAGLDWVPSRLASRGMCGRSNRAVGIDLTPC